MSVKRGLEGSEDDWLPISWAAELLNIHPQTLRYWESKGWITATRTPGGYRRFRRGDVMALLATPPELYKRNPKNLYPDDSAGPDRLAAHLVAVSGEQWACTINYEFDATASVSPQWTVMFESDDADLAACVADGALAGLGFRAAGWQIMAGDVWVSYLERP